LRDDAVGGEWSREKLVRMKSFGDRPIIAFVLAGQAARHNRSFRDAEPIRVPLNRQRILGSFCQTEPLIVFNIYFFQ
jgi:hypothetical protein